MASRLAVAPARDPALRHALGQHFLRSPRVVHAIMEAASIGSGDRVWEIGCGDGALTDPLWQCGQGLTLIELDPALAQAAQQRWPQMVLHQGDAAQLLPRWSESSSAQSLPTVVVSNLPYSAATAILRAFFAPAYVHTRMVLMFQREVARRIVGRESADRGPLSGIAPLLYDIRSVVRVPPGAFNPPPKVESEVLAFRPREDALALQVRQQSEAYWRFLTRAFASRRKTLRNNLSELRGRPGYEALAAARPESLVAQQLWELYTSLRSGL